LRIFAGLLLAAVAGFLSQVAYHKLSNSDFFQITTLKIEGSRMASKEQLTTLSRVDVHSNLLAIDVSQVKSLLESHPWVEAATITRDWPNRLLISVLEKKPIALVNRTTGLFYMDKNGSIIAAASPAQELDFPVITGLEDFIFNQTYSTSTHEVLHDVTKLLKLASGNSSILPVQNISEIHITDNNNMVLHLLERPFPIHMGAEGDVSTKYYRLVKVLKDLYKTKEFSSVSYIRLDYQKDTILVGKAESDRRDQG
jgi:cell division septal protein FtsQ